MVGAVVGAAASIPIGLHFLGAVAAPAFLRLPYHHCAYCLVDKATESLLGVGLYAVGIFAAGWAAVAGWIGGSAVHTAPLLGLARFGLLAGLAMAAGRLLL
jgi:hypothetical protein